MPNPTAWQVTRKWWTRTGRLWQVASRWFADFADCTIYRLDSSRLPSDAPRVGFDTATRQRNSERSEFLPESNTFEVAGNSANINEGIHRQGFVVVIVSSWLHGTQFSSKSLEGLLYDRSRTLRVWHRYLRSAVSSGTFRSDIEPFSAKWKIWAARRWSP